MTWANGRRERKQDALSYVKNTFFFCWWLLGYVPGGAPFSQLSSGVKDAMAISTVWWCSSLKWSKNVHKKAIKTTKTNIPTTRLSRTSGQEEGSGEITTESTYARVGRRVEEEGFGEIQEESTYARAGNFSAASQEESQKDSFVQKENPKVYGQLCNASRVPSGIPTQKKRYTCEVNPQANCISQKGETCETWDATATSESTQYILAWRSEDSKQSAEHCNKRGPVQALATAQIQILCQKTREAFSIPLYRPFSIPLYSNVPHF